MQDSHPIGFPPDFPTFCAEKVCAVSALRIRFGLFVHRRQLQAADDAQTKERSGSIGAGQLRKSFKSWQAAVPTTSMDLEGALCSGQCSHQMHPLSASCFMFLMGMVLFQLSPSPLEAAIVVEIDCYWVGSLDFNF